MAKSNGVEIDSGAPRLTLTPLGCEPQVFRLDPYVCRALADILGAVVRPDDDEVRVTFKIGKLSGKAAGEFLRAMKEAGE